MDLRGLGTVQAFNIVQVKAAGERHADRLPVQEGQEVQQGDIVAQIDPRPYQAALDQAVAQRAEDAAQLQSAQLDLQRFQNLAKSQFAPVQQVDDQQATVNKLAAAIEADNAAIETAQINLGYCTIRAPINGRVSFYQIDVGNLIQVASQTSSHVDHAGQADIGGLHPGRGRSAADPAGDGQGASCRSRPTDGDDKTKLADGELLTPNNAIDTTTGTIQLKATFANDNDALWPGEFVNARLHVDTLHHAVTVPIAAIQHGPNGLYVYTIKPDSTAQQQNVQVDYQDRMTIA